MMDAPISFHRDMKKRLQKTVTEDGCIDMTDEDDLASDRVCVLEPDTLRVVRYDDIPESGRLSVGEDRAGEDVSVLVFY